MTQRRDRDRYAKVPGRLWREPDLSGLSLGARGLLLWSWSHFADAMSDGFIPEGMLPSIAGGPFKKELGELLAAGVWEKAEHPSGKPGYRCAWYLRSNITREEWEAKKVATVTKVTKHRRGPGNPAVTGYSAGTERPETGIPQTQDARRKTQEGAESASEARAPDPRSLRDPDPDPEPDPLRVALLDGFARRWEAALSEGPWPRHAVREQLVELVLDAVRGRSGPAGELERGLDAYFGHCAQTQVRPEFGWTLARDFGRWCSSSSLPAGAASDRAKRVARLQQLASAPITPAPPEAE